MRIHLALATALLVASPSADVWTVGAPGSGADFDRIQLAIDAASAGDVVLVGPGAFDGFLLDKPILVLGAGSDQTTVEPGTDLSGLLIVVGGEQLNGAVATVAGIGVQPSEVSFADLPEVRVSSAEGTVIFHDLYATSIDGAPLEGIDTRALVLSRTELLAAPTFVATLTAIRSALWLVDSQVSKLDAPGESFPLSQFRNVALFDSRASVAGSTLVGHSFDGFGKNDGGAGLSMQESTCAVNRTTLQGGNGAFSTSSPGSGGFAAGLTLDSELRVGASTLAQGGFDGQGLNQQEPYSVEPGSNVLQDPVSPPTASASPGAAVAGDALAVTFFGDPGDSGVALASLTPGPAAVLPGVVGDVFIDLTAPISLGAFVLDANGEAQIAGPAPAPLEPTLLTFQWARLGASIELSNPAFISLQ